MSWYYIRLWIWTGSTWRIEDDMMSQNDASFTVPTDSPPYYFLDSWKWNGTGWSLNRTADNWT